MATGRRRVVWTTSARIALDEALEYIAQQSPAGAQKILHATLDLANVYPAGSPVIGSGVRLRLLAAPNGLPPIGVNLLRLAEEGVAPWHVCWRDVGMTGRAVAYRIDEIAAQAHQRPVLAFQVEGDRRNLEA